jgi:hypothetical protein
MSDGTTIGVWIGEDDDLITEFDALFGTDPDYSRSREIKRAMETHMTVEQVLRDVDADVAPRERQSIVRQALLDLYRDRQE